MYLAKMDDEFCGAKYYYKDNSIYFNIDFSLADADFFALHECLHYLQEVKDKKGNLIRLGLFDFIKNHGMALNEASVQLMTVTALNNPMQEVSYYNLEFPSNSVDSYPLECAIVRQMSYFTGTYPLYYSTLHGNDVFKNTFIALSNSKAFNVIETNLDKMLSLENNLAIYFDELKSASNNVSKVRQLHSIVENTKNDIMNLFLECQNTIISNCFSKAIGNVHTVSDVKDLKEKIYNFKDYIATNSSYTFYNDFYRQFMEKLDSKQSHIEEFGPYNLADGLSTNLTVISTSKKAFSLFRRLFTKLGILRQNDF